MLAGAGALVTSQVIAGHLKREEKKEQGYIKIIIFTPGGVHKIQDLKKVGKGLPLLIFRNFQFWKNRRVPLLNFQKFWQGGL